MHGETPTLLGLLAILFLGLIVPDLFRRTVHLPFVTSIILIGALLGPHGFNVIASNEVIDFFGFLGFTFLMLMAGLETHISEVKKSARPIFILAAINAAIPFATGLLIARIFGYDWVASVLLGTIFVSSSVAVIIPFLKNRKIGSTIRQIMLPAFVIQDLVSMMLLASVFQSISNETTFPLPVYFAILLISIGVLYAVVPRLADQFIKKRLLNKKQQHEDELRFVIVLLIAVLLYFSALGVHPILAAFLVGMLLADVGTHQGIASKIHILGYGLFVPVFFFVVGTEMNLGIFLELNYRDMLIASVIIGLIASKFFSGLLAGKIVGFDTKESMVYGSVSTAQLTTTLAAAYAAATLGIFDDTMITAIVTLSVITNIGVPIALNAIIGTKKKKVSSAATLQTMEKLLTR